MASLPTGTVTYTGTIDMIVFLYCHHLAVTHATVRPPGGIEPPLPVTGAAAIS
jgi:hypothetical protein